MDPIPALPAHQDLAGVAQAVRVAEERHDRPEVDRQHHGPQRRCRRRSRTIAGEDRRIGPRDPRGRDGQPAPGSRVRVRAAPPEKLGDQPRARSRRASDPHRSSIQIASRPVMLRQHVREERLGLVPEPLGRQRPADVLASEQMPDPRAARRTRRRAPPAAAARAAGSPAGRRRPPSAGRGPGPRIALVVT